MPPPPSAGILLYRRTADGTVQVLLGHMGGPYWERKDAGAWTIPKGEYGPDEDPLVAARREFTEEIGSPPADGPLIDLGTAVQSTGKQVVIWAVEGDLDTSTVVSNLFEMEWPPRSGRVQEFPEVDRAGWFDLATARTALLARQVPFVDRLEQHLRAGGRADAT
jgi:predicted NUDIX family NTP pyrophosphohydrolase